MHKLKTNLHFAENVFDDKNMKSYLTKDVYTKLKKIIDGGEELDGKIAHEVAIGMKEWALDNGATHYTHWFQPLNDSVAEKHDSFLSFDKNMKPILEFGGSDLIKGESDASSFPSGNLRATFEARGYTVWDCTSPAFLRKDQSGITLVVPTAFISYGGEALDKKTPLLKSMEVINNEATKLLNLIDSKNKVKNVKTMLGVEQEYFLIDREKYLKRKDLIYTGRTLFGAKPPKGQELDDHYYGAIRRRIGKFMSEVNDELWLLGVPAKTQHNEVAPAQHELACIYEEANVSVDHNQIVMETLKKVATKYNLVCLLHEKPFKYVNGSGKHNNWSLVTDKGKNILSPGVSPHENRTFLLILSCIISAIDKYSPLLIASCAGASKDLRLGASEAPPNIISVFVGEQIESVIEEIIAKGHASSSKSSGTIKQNISTLPVLYKDATDRNRTSPFAFTGNKFEFRMVGSSDSPAMPITTINTIVAKEFSIASEKLMKAKDKDSEINKIIRDNFKEHRRIIFEGDGYNDNWKIEAEKRGLPVFDSTIDTFKYYLDKDVIDLFSDFGIFNKNELHCRYEVELEKYVKILKIESLTMVNLAKKNFLPCGIHYTTMLSNSINSIKNVDNSLDISVQRELLDDILKIIRKVKTYVDELDQSIEKADEKKGIDKIANYYKDTVRTSMEKLRDVTDKLEMIVDKSMWPIPSYGDLLFEVSGV